MLLCVRFRAAQEMFRGASFFNADIGGWEVGAVTTMWVRLRAAAPPSPRARGPGGGRLGGTRGEKRAASFGGAARRGGAGRSAGLVGAGWAATWPLRGCSPDPRLSACPHLVSWVVGLRISGQGLDQTIQESEIYI